MFSKVYGEFLLFIFFCNLWTIGYIGLYRFKHNYCCIFLVEKFFLVVFIRKMVLY
jgi:hypothetical protein